MVTNAPVTLTTSEGGGTGTASICTESHTTDNNYIIAAALTHAR